MTKKAGDGDDNTTPSKGKFEVFVELVKALAWPVLVLFLVLRFGGPVGNVLNQLPDLVSRSNVVEIGTVKLQLGNKLPEPQSDVKDALAKLTSQDIQILIRGGESYFDSAASGEQAYAGLIALKLAEGIPSDQLKNNYKYGGRLTPLGERTREYLIQVMSVFLQTLAQPQATPKPTP